MSNDRISGVWEKPEGAQKPAGPFNLNDVYPLSTEAGERIVEGVRLKLTSIPDDEPPLIA